MHAWVVAGGQGIQGASHITSPHAHRLTSPLLSSLQAQVEAPLVSAAILPPGWVDSVALNLYHDGSEGIQSHYDDAERFERPIYSLRLFSDSRLSFGTQLYGWARSGRESGGCDERRGGMRLRSLAQNVYTDYNSIPLPPARYTNGAFCIPMPRGCVTVMESGGYAANGAKHCVRPVDMTGKSAGLILRRINPGAWAAARALHLAEAEHWMRCLSLGESLRGDDAALRALRQPQPGEYG